MTRCGRLLRPPLKAVEYPKSETIIVYFRANCKLFYAAFRIFSAFEGIFQPFHALFGHFQHVETDVDLRPEGRE